MSEQQMKVSDIPEYGTDPDLEYLNPNHRVRVEMMPIREPDWTPSDARNSAERIARYAEIYRQHGANGMPPVVCSGSVAYQIAGMHRAYAAYVAGLKEIPAYVVSVF